MPETKIKRIPNTDKDELLTANPGFKTPGRTIDAFLLPGAGFSPDAIERMAMISRALGLSLEQIQTKLKAGEIVKW